MDKKTLEIIVALKDLATQQLQRIQASFKTFKRDIADLAKEIDRFGRQMAQLGSKMAFVGGAMIAPFVLAMKSMNNYSFAAARENERLGNVFLQLSKTLSDAAIPTIRTFNDMMSKGVNLLNSINPQLRQQVASWTLWSGAILLVSGSLLIYLGKLYQAVNILHIIPALISPIGLSIAGIAVAVGLLIAFWDKLGYAVNFLSYQIKLVANVVDVFASSFLMALNQIFEYFQRFLSLVTGGIEKLFGLLSKIPGPQSSFFAQMEKSAKSLRVELDKTADHFKQVSNSMGQNISNILSGKNGALASGIQGIPTAFNDIKAKVQKASKDLEPILKDLKTRLYETSKSFADGFADAFDQVLFEGKNFAESMKSLFSQMGRDIIKDFMKTSMRNLINAAFKQPMEGGTGLGGFFSFKTIGALLGGIGRGSEKITTSEGEGVRKSIDGMANSAKNAGSIFNGLKDKLSGFGNMLGQTKGVFDGVFGALKGFGSNIMSFGGQLLGGIGGLLGGFGSALSGIMGGLGGILGGIGGGIGGLFGGLGGLFSFFGHTGGLVTTAGIMRYHSGGLAGLKPDEVPAILQSGEGIVNRSGMGTIGRDGLRDLNTGRIPGGAQTQEVHNHYNTFVIQAWDAQDIKRNEKKIVGLVEGAYAKNGSLRKTLKSN